MQKELIPIWKLLDPIPEAVDRELQDHSPDLRQLLYNRGILDSEQAFYYLNKEGSLYDPLQLSGMDKAVDRIWHAIDGGEKIAVYGDYDVDGVTATALLVQVLRSLGALNTREYIPNRFEEGYGLNFEALETLRTDDVHLIITVDCGIRSLKEAERAIELGLDLIISDHHEPENGEIPAALVVICPKQDIDHYPEKNLSGVGLAFKIAEALVKVRPDYNLDVNNWLDLVAVGTVADLVPLTGENRTLVKSGLKVFRARRRPGLASLAGAAGANAANLSARDIGFVIGPRLNAAGRLESAMEAYHLLMAGTFDDAAVLAQKLDDQNRKRQEKTRDMHLVAERIAEENVQDHIIFTTSEEFEMGIVGLVASRLVEAHYRPAIVGAKGEEYTRASCRSIPEFHITKALDECSDLFKRHGGHAMAAGFTIKNDRLAELEDRLREIGARELADRDLQPVIKGDLELCLRDIRPDKLLKDIEMLEPTGMGNRGALFISKNLKVVKKFHVGSEKKHLRIEVTDGKVNYTGIAFRQGHWFDQMPKAIDIIYSFEINSYNGRETLQLNVKDIKPSEV